MFCFYLPKAKAENRLSSTGSFCNCLQQPKLRQAEGNGQTLPCVFHVSVRDLSRCAITCCLPGHQQEAIVRNRIWTERRCKNSALRLMSQAVSPKILHFCRLVEVLLNGQIQSSLIQITQESNSEMTELLESTEYTWN